ncbi:amidase [Nocardia sp. NPDC058640]|uniref:amidase n=1 Tax=Nocardia sp. NPDC058640 TaxID=3346571 RepID=UPI003660BF0C
MDEFLNGATIADIRSMLSSRELSVVELVEWTLARLDSVEPMLHAFVTVDRAYTLDQAAIADNRIHQDGVGAWDRAPLLGVAISVKDLVPTAGLRTTRGSLESRDWTPRADAIAVARLRAAGAVILGKTVTSECGWSAGTSNQLTPATSNPWNINYSSGGSSGGAAASIAVGVGTAAIGTDGAGSIRVPAAFCGIVGLKPTFGRVPYEPLSPERLSHMGPLARTVADAATLMEVMSGPDPADPYSLSVPPCSPPPIGQLRIGWVDPPGPYHAESDVQRACVSALRVLEEQGHIVDSIGTPFPDLYDELTVLLAAEAGSQPSASDPTTDLERLAVVNYGRTLSGTEVLSAERTRARLTQSMARLMERWDILAMPTVPIEPFPVNSCRPDHQDSHVDPMEWLHWCSATYPFNLTGQPAISIPVGLSPRGFPVGLQLVARWNEEPLLVSVAETIEQTLPHYRALIKNEMSKLCRL